MRNTDGLKPFVKNDPRRINKPKGAVSMKTILARFLESKSKIDTNPITQERVNKLTAKEVIVLQLLAKGMKGDLQAIKEILDRFDGKVVEKVQQELKINQMGTVKINDKPLEVDFGKS
jgi:hypothetical protein